ncbi:hypothetical protein OROGR_029668 [Orobanche gracilis]
MKHFRNISWNVGLREAIGPPPEVCLAVGGLGILHRMVSEETTYLDEENGIIVRKPT